MDERQLDHLELILNGVKEKPDAGLTAWEENFIADIADRFETYGERTRISDRQWEFINKIGEKVL